MDEVQISHNVVLDKMGRINGGIEDIESLKLISAIGLTGERLLARKTS